VRVLARSVPNIVLLFTMKESTRPRRRRDKYIMRSIVFLLLLMIAVFAVGPVRDIHAQNPGQLIESYTARLSARDHFNSNGVRLRTAAAIIRQDRANFYVYGLRDDEDQPDSFFSNKANRARLEQMLENGRTTPEATYAIVNGTPLIRVDIYGNGINVMIISE
jgi:hypothetical protein